MFKYKRFGVNFFINEDDVKINWSVYWLFLLDMWLIVFVLIYLRVMCNFLDEGFVYIDYVCVKFEGYDLFGVW